MRDPLRVIIVIIIIATTWLGTLTHFAKAEDKMDNQNQAENQSHPYIGMWVTGDGHIRHELLPSGRYDEARGTRKSAYQGRYVMTGNHIDYWDDTGFTADGDFIDGVLHHAGMIFYRQR
jgi:hypothetical protein